jgi:hypothetical protein
MTNNTALLDEVDQPLYIVPDHDKVPFCLNIKQFQDDLHQEPIYLEAVFNIYINIMTWFVQNVNLTWKFLLGFAKQQLIRKCSRNLRQHKKTGESSRDISSLFHDSTSLHEGVTDTTIEQSINTDTNDSIEEPPSITNTTNKSSHDSHIPLLHAVDKPSTYLPTTITMSEDHLRACVGFHQVETMKKHFNDLYLDSIKLDTLPPDAVFDIGDLATMHKKPRCTKPVPRPKCFIDTMHMDVIFGLEISVGNVHYGLLFTDHFSWMTYLYPLQNLTTDIPKQLEAFFAHIGSIPHHLISDFDLKLIRGKAQEYLNSLFIHVNAAPSYHQDKNGLVECHWQTMVTMARNWLASAELPSSFWFYAICQAAEVCNYFHYKLEDGTLTTPFELAHHTKPDL